MSDLETYNLDIDKVILKNIIKNKSKLDIHKFSKNQTIFYGGHVPYGLFILLSGEVEIINMNSKTKKVVSPAILGLSALINKEPYSATVRTLNNCETCFLSNQEYQSILSKNTDSIFELKKINSYL